MPGAARRDLAAAFTRALGIPTMKAAAARDRSAGGDRLRQDNTCAERAFGRRTALTVRAPAPTDAVAMEFELLDGRLRLRRSSTLRSTKRRLHAGPGGWLDPFPGPPRPLSMRP